MRLHTARPRSPSCSTRTSPDRRGIYGFHLATVIIPRRTSRVDPASELLNICPHTGSTTKHRGRRPAASALPRSRSTRADLPYILAHRFCPVNSLARASPSSIPHHQRQENQVNRQVGPEQGHNVVRRPADYELPVGIIVRPDHRVAAARRGAEHAVLRRDWASGA